LPPSLAPRARGPRVFYFAEVLFIFGCELRFRLSSLSTRAVPTMNYGETLSGFPVSKSASCFYDQEVLNLPR